MLLAQFSLASAVFMLALVFTIGILLMRSQRHLARRDSSPIVRVERPKQLKDPRGHHAPEEVARWEVGMHETARELSGQLESRMSALLHLVREADRAAARLEAAMAAAAGTPGQPSPAAVEEDADATAAPPVAATDPSVPPAAERFDEIYTLADYGFDPLEISRRTGTPAGEVQLVLSLRTRR